MMTRMLGFAYIPVVVLIAAVGGWWWLDNADKRSDALMYVGNCAHERALEEGWHTLTPEGEWKVFSKECSERYELLENDHE